MDFGASSSWATPEGLLHVSNMAHKRVEKAGDLVAVGQERRSDPEIQSGGKRIGLGLKQLQEVPGERDACATRRSSRAAAGSRA